MGQSKHGNGILFCLVAVLSWGGLFPVLQTVLGTVNACQTPLPRLPTLLGIMPQILYMVIAAGFLGVLSWNAGKKILSPINGVLFMDLVPVTTFTFKALQGYDFATAELVGAGITTSALILNNVFLRIAAKRAAAAL